MSARPIYSDIPGAPFEIGQTVTIGEPLDDTGYPQYTGQVGTVTYFEYSCGCGQTYPNDPMIGVTLTDGTLIEFWNAELE